MMNASLITLTTLLVGGAADEVTPSATVPEIRWHGDYAAALAASAQSGKPVLLFQLLGRLDEEFC
ncbi:MAG: hypothetical protein O2816_02770 [Planctomycetota bacterium]|nr:hypothetical protein [Planctomycetota bacterium]